MSRSKWSLVFGLLAALSLLTGRNLARATDVESAPQPPDSTTTTISAVTPAQQPALPQANNACAQQACDGEVCFNRNWIIDVDAAFLAPVQHQNFGSVAIGTANATFTGLSTVTTESDVLNNEDFVPTPRITLGLQGDCWGFLARYWRMETCNAGGSFATGTGNGSFGDAEFGAQTADLEVTRLLDGNCCDHMYRVSFGVRYAELSEAGSVDLTQVVPTPFQSLAGSVIAQHDFSGVGPTVGFQGFRRVNCSNFYLFYDLRASALFENNATEYVGTRAQSVVPLAGGGYGLGYDFTQVTATASNANLFIGELQLGGQWDVPLKCVPANAFFRFAFEYQYWTTGNAGGVTDFAAAGQVNGPAVVAQGTSNGNTHVDLVGFNLGAGLTW
jgi:hypothetical protein